MKYIAILGLLATVCWSSAQAQEADKLFRGMEKKLLTAKAFEVTFDYQFEKRKAKGELLVTQDNKVRLKVVGHFEEKRKAGFDLVADGKHLKTQGARFFVQSNGQPVVEAGGQSNWETPKNFHAVLGGTLSRGGVWFTVLAMPYLQGKGGELDLDGEESKMKVYDFKLAGVEKVRAQEANVVHYRFGNGSDRFDEEMTLWIDAKTLLPLKRSFALKIGGARIVENYHEFKLDPKIDAKAFELPKVVAARGQDVGKPFPADVVPAWEKAGAEVGWLSPGEGRMGVNFRRGGGEGKPGEVPGFRFREWQAGVLAKLPTPEQGFGLDLSDTKLTDDDLKELAMLKNLRSLSVGGTKVTDKGLKTLAKLKQLQVLFLDSTNVTDAGLTELAALTQLRLLDLGGTDVTGVGLRALAGLTQLRTLLLIKANLTETGLRALGGIKALQTLNFGGTEVEDAWLKELSELKELRTLDLTNTPITDAGLKELMGHKQLRSLSLEMTKVTEAGIRELEKALPDLKIHE